MPKLSSTALLLAKGRSIVLRSYCSPRPVAASSSYSILQAKLGARSSASLRTASYPNSAQLSKTGSQKRNMSSPADHKPSKQASKAPQVPRPSSRYAIITMSLDIEMLTRIASCSFPLRTRSYSSTAYRKPLVSHLPTSSPAAPFPKPTTARSPAKTTQEDIRMGPRIVWQPYGRLSRNAASYSPRAKRPGSCSPR